MRESAVELQCSAVPLPSFCSEVAIFLQSQLTYYICNTKGFKKSLLQDEETSKESSTNSRKIAPSVLVSLCSTQQYSELSWGDASDHQRTRL